MDDPTTGRDWCDPPPAPERSGYPDAGENVNRSAFWEEALIQRKLQLSHNSILCIDFAKWKEAGIPRSKRTGVYRAVAAELLLHHLRRAWDSINSEDEEPASRLGNYTHSERNMQILWVFTAMVSVAFGLLIRPYLLSVVAWIFFWFLLLFIGTFVELFPVKAGVAPDVAYVDQFGYLFPHMLVAFVALVASLILAHQVARALAIREKKNLEEKLKEERIALEEERRQLREAQEQRGEEGEDELVMITESGEAAVEDEVYDPSYYGAHTSKLRYHWSTYLQRGVCMAGLLTAAILLQALAQLSVDGKVPWNVIASTIILAGVVVMNAIGYYVYTRRRDRLTAHYDVNRDTTTALAASAMLFVYVAGYFIAFSIDVWGTGTNWGVGENAFAVYATVLNLLIVAIGVVWARGAFSTILSRG